MTDNTPAVGYELSDGTFVFFGVDDEFLKMIRFTSDMSYSSQKYVAGNPCGSNTVDECIPDCATAEDRWTTSGNENTSGKYGINVNAISPSPYGDVDGNYQKFLFERN